MNTSRLICLALSGLLAIGFSSCKNQGLSSRANAKNKGKQVQFTAEDGVKIFADYYDNSSENLIILFHQARSNARGEYRTIIPRLSKMGYDILAVDQRTGGQIHGSYNRTMKDISMNRYNYCQAYPDLVASLNFAKTTIKPSKLAVWGSSYSAGLVIKLGHEYGQDISAVLAFSPASGGPMVDCKPDDFLEGLKTPLLVLRPGSEMEYESVTEQFNLAIKSGHQTYVAPDGVHGSSMLVEERTKSNVDNTWNAVTMFLNKQLP